MIRVSFGINNLITTKLSELEESNKKSFWCIMNAWSSYRLIDESVILTLGQLVLHIWLNTYVNPAELGGNQSRILCTVWVSVNWHPHIVDSIVEVYTETMFWEAGKDLWQNRKITHLLLRARSQKPRSTVDYRFTWAIHKGEAEIKNLEKLEIIKRAEGPTHWVSSIVSKAPKRQEYA